MQPPSEHEIDMDTQYDSALRRMRRPIWVIVAILGVLVVMLTGAVIWLIVQNSADTSRVAQEVVAAQEASDHRWCATMDLLTIVPVAAPKNAAANPSRESSYQLYVDFTALKKSFGCDSP